MWETQRDIEALSFLVPSQYLLVHMPFVAFGNSLFCLDLELASLLRHLLESEYVKKCEPEEVQQGQVQGPAPGEEQPHASVHAQGSPAGEQLCGEGPGCPGGRQVDHEPAVCPGCQEGQWDPGMH